MANSKKATKTAKNVKRTKTARQSLKQMIEAGILKAGQKVQAFYKGREFNGSILADGRVRINGETYRSLSDAAQSIATQAGNKKASINGYTFFGVKTADGIVPVAALRQ